VPGHLWGHGCSTCSEKRKHTTESFIAKSKMIWGSDTFDYSLVEYVNNKHHITLKCKKNNHTFSCTPSNHFSLKGCPHCAVKKFVSVGETEWLNSLNIPLDCRNKWINVNGQKFNVDGMINGTIYEYFGDFWHGNPKRFGPDRINPFCGLTMKELYDHTMTRKQALNEGGFVVIVMWEFDWMQLRKTRPHVNQTT